eukprot:1188232-Prorocentrum_minimum.AAC.2
MFDALFTEWRTVKLRERDPTCAACGDNPTLTGGDSLDRGRQINAKTISSYDYASFSGPFTLEKGPEDSELLPDSSRVSAADLAEAMREDPDGIVLVDVRPALQVE